MKVDYVVIGAGILGLVVSRELLKRQPDARLIVLEKESTPAFHQSGHNSGVIHSGIYYTPGSLKAEGSVRGGQRLIQYCDKHDIPYDLCGKLIVATEDSELKRLHTLHERGLQNGVQGLELMGPDRMREIEPHVQGIEALYSPATGIVEFPRVARAFAEDITRAGGEVRYNAPVIDIEQQPGSLIVKTPGDEIETAYLIGCAGLASDRLAGLTGPTPPVRIIPFRGSYYNVREERRDLCRALIYPVPDPEFPFLGVHFTRVMNGEVWVGPNAVLAFAREGYHLLDINLRDMAESLAWPGFRKLIAKEWRYTLSELVVDIFKPLYMKSIQRYLPELEGRDLLPGPSGVRAQAVAQDGTLIKDFLFVQHERALHVVNAPSPAATSALVLAETIVDRVEAGPA